MKNILIVTPNPSDSCSWYRTIGPFSRLREDLPGWTYSIPTRIDWTHIKSSDVVFMQRPFMRDHLVPVRLAKLAKRPVWIDFDDDLFSVPESNPCYGMICTKDNFNSIEEIILSADIITCTTEELGRQIYNRTGRCAEVIPNAIDEKTFPVEKLIPRNKTIAWRGSKTHDKDLDIYTYQILSVLESAEDYKFTFIGNPFWRLLEQMRNGSYQKIPELDPLVYMETLKKLAPKIMMVPLESSVFNFCKSNIAWIEATWSGAYTISPDWEQWHCPGNINYTTNSSTSFTNAILSALKKDQDEIEIDIGRAREHMLNHYSLGVVNKQRLEILKSFS